MAKTQRKLIVGATTVVVVLGGGGYAIAQAGGASASYRLATATVGNVERTLTLGGTVNSSARHNVSFAESGTVTSVYVSPGEQVKAGQVLAALDPAAADATLLSAKAALAKAQAALDSTTTSQSQAVAAANTPSTQGGSSSASAGLKRAQAALMAAVRKADEAMQASRAAGSAVSLGCVDVGIATGGSSGHGPGPTPTATPTADPTSSPTSTPSGPTQAQLQQCTDVLSALSQAQAKVSEAQQAEQMALDGLARVLQTSSASSSASNSSSGASPSNSNANRSSAGSATQGSGATSSASRLASEQAQVDQAEATLVAAQVTRDNTILRAPVAGRVVALGVSKGSAVSTSTAAVTLVGAGASTVVVAVPLSQIAMIKAGEPASVVVSGSSKAIGAVVSNVGILATTSSSGTTTYPVTVSLTGSAPTLQGIGASVTVVTGSATHALTVPSSAITTTGTRSTVDVYQAGKVTTTVVDVGVMGATTASITSGLQAGEQVVLADLNASIPASTTSGTGLRGFGGAGGLGGGLGGGTFRVRSGG